MTVSKKVTLSADGATATVADATLTDVFTTALSTTSAVTGLYGLGQKIGLFVGGMAFQNNRLGQGLNPFKG
jgi:hypothetical protein